MLYDSAVVERFFDYDLWFAGAAQFAILIASFQVPHRLGWRKDLSQLMSFNRKLLGYRVGSQF